MLVWEDPDPVFFDLETQSGADLKQVGGRLYAADPTTRVLCGVFLVGGAYHCWIPAHAAPAKPPDPARLWPAQLSPPRPVEVWVGDPPPAVRDALAAGRTFVAHNCFGFDRFVWREKIAPLVGGAEPPWADTLPLARAAGFPGRLDALAQQIVGVGKDAGRRILMKYVQATVERSDAGDAVVYPRPGAGDLEVILRYNVADVDLLRRAWDVLAEHPVEADAIAAHDAANERGVGVDVGLAAKLAAVSGESVARAAGRVAELTGGALHAGNIRSVPQVNAWLAARGVRILSHERDAAGARKKTLRKDFVEQALANPWLMLDDDAPAAAVADIPPEVFEVLRVRAAALRITGAKGERAVLRAGADGRARDLLTYHQAHTGRSSSAGIQIHNLPRPKKGVPVGELLGLHESGAWGHDAAAAYDLIASRLPAGKSVDDAVASLLRPLFVPAPGDCLVVADYAAIECRVLAWLAGEEGLMHSLATGADVYKEMAGRIYGKAPADVTDAERQVGKVTVLGCGYGMSAEKFRIYCGLQGIDLAAAGTTADACVGAFRGAYPGVAGRPAGQIDGRPYYRGGLWDQVGRAALDAVTLGGVRRAGRCAWAFDGSALVCELPSGRRLRYRGARVEERVPGYALAAGLDRTKPTLVYEGQYGPVATYGAKLVENIDQATARDVMCSAWVGCELRGDLPVVLTVHDEIVCEAPAGRAAESLDDLLNVMASPPEWAAGLPVAVEGYAAPRYLKAPPDGWPKGKRSNSC